MSSFDRLLRLAQKTGDRLIVHDSYTNRSTVLLSLDDYERLWDEAKAESFLYEDDEECEEENDSFRMSDDEDEPDPWQRLDTVLEDQYGRMPIPPNETPLTDEPISEETPHPLPYTPRSADASWKEEPLEDEPLFFEEPL